MNSTTTQRLAAIFGFLAVALGAFGAHGLESTLKQHGTAEWWQTAGLYHLVHSVVLLVLAQRANPPRLAIWLFAVGITAFSGSLYVFALVNMRWLAAITPLGGVLLLAGWLTLARGPGKN